MVAGIRAAGALLVPFLLSAFIAVISAPLLPWLKRRHVPAALGIPLIIAAVTILGVSVIALVGTSVKDFTENLPSYQERLHDEMEGVLEWLAAKGIEAPQDVILENFNPDTAVQLFGKMVSGLGSAFSSTFLIILTVVFILLEASSLPGKLRAIAEGQTDSLAGIDRIVADVRHYMVLKTAVSLLTGVLVGLWLAILGVDYPVMWGMLAFLLNYVPNIGSIIAAVPAVLLAFIQLGLSKALFAAGGYVVVNVIVGNVIEPRLLGKGLGLSTLVVFVSLVFWGWLLGPVGMLLSVPLTMTAKIALATSDETRWIAILLGPPIPEKRQ